MPNRIKQAAPYLSAKVAISHFQALMQDLIFLSPEGEITYGSLIIS
jgi:hypothetical protein